MRLILTLALITLAPAAYASAPAGVWALPYSVTVTGAEGETPGVLIAGVFTVHTGEGAEGGQWGFSGFEAAVEGYMHYRCKPGEKEMCLLQWQDIKQAADDQGCVGWGQNDGSNGTVYPSGVPAGEPDPWDLGMGIVTGTLPCEYLATYDPQHGGEDVADPAPDTAPPADTALPPETVEDSTTPGVADGEDTTPADVPTATDSGPGAVDAQPGAQDTAQGGKTSDDGGCARGPASVFGVLGLAFVALRRRAAR